MTVHDASLSDTSVGLRRLHFTQKLHQTYISEDWCYSCCWPNNRAVNPLDERSVTPPGEWSCNYIRLLDGLAESTSEMAQSSHARSAVINTGNKLNRVREEERQSGRGRGGHKSVCCNCEKYTMSIHHVVKNIAKLLCNWC